MGGVMSGIGKGTIASSIGVLLKASGYVITHIKIDPYLNEDAGTLSPFEHGECYVLEDGGETDLDMGNYERFSNIKLTKIHNITTGKIYKKVLEKERKGEYLGKTVQIVPHITDEIQNWIKVAAQIAIDVEIPDICIIELGGTAGDIESLPFIEALRQLSYNSEDFGDTVLFTYVGYAPYLKASDETKTKPVQQSVNLLRNLGICPDLLFVRCENAIDEKSMKKLAIMCNVKNIICIPDISNLYCMPQYLAENSLNNIVRCPIKSEKYNEIMDEKWKMYAEQYDKINGGFGEIIRIGIVGKYVGLQDSYLSLHRAIEHAAIQLLFGNKSLKIEYINAELYDENDINCLDAIIIAGGFDVRGMDGKLRAIKYARENNIPILGICLGMQLMAIEFARNILKIADANSEEMSKNCENKVVIYCPSNDNNMGGTMRLGLKETKIDENSTVAKIYKIWSKNNKNLSENNKNSQKNKNNIIKERHRHRYEINPDWIEKFEENGFKCVGLNTDNDGKRVEIMELIGKKYFIGCQFHPEYNTSIENPHPLFMSLLSCVLGNKK